MEEEYFLSELIAQCKQDGKRWFPNNQSLEFLGLCLAGEVGEVANIIKKIGLGRVSPNDSHAQEHLAEEIIDVLIYLCSMMGHSYFENVDWMQVWNEKRTFNESRFNPILEGDRD
jgi:NTP pyrophosphatase (non-canonical NTP hydrolase)